MKSTTDVRIVLVRPRDPGNVGAACRAMKCMGLGSLTIVPGTLLDPRRARTLAHNAEEVLDNARIVTDLREAVSDAVLVAGTTRRRGRNRKYFTLFPEQLGERIAATPKGTVAVLFGNEETGLTDEELALCNVAVTIPASPQLASLNLSHAVQVICYEIFRARNASRLTPFLPITGAALDDLVGVITGALKTIGFFTIVEPDQMGVFWKDILARAQLSGNEARRVEVTFRKIAGLVAGKGVTPADGPPGKARRR
jgi:tRNA/rRNA methyltransferase